MSTPAKEKRFLDALEALFTGAEVEGDSGFVNLMRMKRAHFQSIKPNLMDEIEKRTESQPAFREELFDKLHTFFSRYFCESGSIYFRHLPAFSKTYERVYADGQDVALSWKTQMLYYVKSDVLVRSMPVELNEEGQPQQTRRFYFDASECEHKKSNEKREFIFALDGVKRGKEGKVMHIKVSYPARGNKTKFDEIIKEARKEDISLTEDQLQKSIGAFQRQTEADFFINKDARGFLREQFDLWMYQYIFKEETIFEEERIKQIQFIKDTAYDIIDFISQFEDELRRVWEKPKFVRDVNYVVTLDKLTDGILKKIAAHKGAKAQIKEWQELGLVENKFSVKEISTGRKGQGGKYQFLPLDTKYFKNLELDILNGLGNLDEVLGGELVHSENWQALNTLKNRYRKRVKCIYIDPPYNTDASKIIYKNDYKHSSWVTLMENRITQSTSTMEDDSVFIAAIDDAEMLYLSHILEVCFPNRDRNVVVVNHHPAGAGLEDSNISRTHEYAIFMTPAKVKILVGEKKKEKQTERGFVRTGTAESNLRIGRPNSFYAILVNPENSEIVGGEKPPQGKTYPKGNTPEGYARIYPVGVDGTERVWRRSYESFLREYREGSIICRNGRSIYQIIDETNRHHPVFSNWTDKKYNAGVHGSNLLTDIMGRAGTFSYPKSIYNVQDCIRFCTPYNEKNVILDFFAGSGTTAHAVINLNREDGGNRNYLLIEMGDYFHAVLLPRIKKIIYSKDWTNGQPVSREGGSHFLKYYRLEQYEETLKNAHYQGGKQLELDSAKSPFQQYAFFADDKLTHAVKPKNATLKIDLHDLYPDIDIPESLANILGKQIRKRTADMVTFEDGSTEKSDPLTMDDDEKRRFISLIRPYLWWGE